ncbi:hypothetical protein AB9P05_22435 [Roseivirga sp. BDSF3-8]
MMQDRDRKSYLVNNGFEQVYYLNDKAGTLLAKYKECSLKAPKEEVNI